MLSALKKYKKHLNSKVLSFQALLNDLNKNEATYQKKRFIRLEAELTTKIKAYQTFIDDINNLLAIFPSESVVRTAIVNSMKENTKTDVVIIDGEEQYYDFTNIHRSADKMIEYFKSVNFI